jgi:hypothetical protein
MATLVPPRYTLTSATSPSDHLRVTHDKNTEAVVQRNRTDGQSPDGWSLKLTALSADRPDRLVRYLTGALLACGGWVLTRTTQGNQAAELDFEFARAACVDIYSVLIAAGLELSRDSHLQMAELCHCTKNLIESRAFDIARADLVVYHSASTHHHDDYAPAPTG